MSRVFITTSTFCEFSKEPLLILEKERFEITLNRENRKITHNEMEENISKYDRIIAGTENYDEQI